MVTVLVADDDPKLLKMLGRTLAYEGCRVLSATNGREALLQVEAQHPDVIVLDWLMPGLSGVEVTSRLRAAHDETLILMLTARDAIEDRVEGLESGADDYLVKPFAPAELLARIHALLRRSDAAKIDRPLVCAGVTLDPATRETRRADRLFELTPTEFDLLHYFIRHPARCCSETTSWRRYGATISAAMTMSWKSTSGTYEGRWKNGESRV